MIKSFICPKCNKETNDYPALSRVDNKTKICTNCGTMEAIEAYKNHLKDNDESLTFEICECGCLGGSTPLRNNNHKDRFQKGHGACITPNCGCQQFTWKGFCDKYGRLI
jgi:transcription elongation factor Elf1